MDIKINDTQRLWNNPIQYILVQHISIRLEGYKNSNININKETKCYNYATIYINKKHCPWMFGSYRQMSLGHVFMPF